MQLKRIKVIDYDQLQEGEFDKNEDEKSKKRSNTIFFIQGGMSSDFAQNTLYFYRVSCESLSVCIKDAQAVCVLCDIYHIFVSPE